MLTDRFYSGPLDGQEQPADRLVEVRRFDPVSGALYVRDPDREQDGVRAWKLAAASDLGAPMTHLAVAAHRGEAVTLACSDAGLGRGLGAQGSVVVWWQAHPAGGSAGCLTEYFLVRLELVVATRSGRIALQYGRIVPLD